MTTSSAFGNTYAGKNASGDMYAGHDGNVYQNTSSGWQKYDNGSWNSVNTQQAQQDASRSHRAISNNIPTVRLTRNSATKASIRAIPRETLILKA
jgi:hypothetical protein